jgi:transposase
MEMTETPVQRGRKRLWSAEKKLEVLQEWRNGTPLEEVCRKHGIQAVMMYRWRRQLEKGLAERGQMVPKSEMAGLEKKVEELERALGRKALEVDILKKTFEIKGLKLPDGM